MEWKKEKCIHTNVYTRASLTNYKHLFLSRPNGSGRRSARSQFPRSPTEIQVGTPPRAHTQSIHTPWLVSFGRLQTNTNCAPLAHKGQLDDLSAETTSGDESTRTHLPWQWDAVKAAHRVVRSMVPWPVHRYPREGLIASLSHWMHTFSPVTSLEMYLVMSPLISSAM